MSDDQKGVTNNAQEYEDYIPLHETIEFASGENEKTVKIELVIDKYKGGKTNNDKIDPDDVADEDEEEIDQGEDAQDVMFKVKIEKPHQKSRFQRRISAQLLLFKMKISRRSRMSTPRWFNISWLLKTQDGCLNSELLSNLDHKLMMKI